MPRTSAKISLKETTRWQLGKFTYKWRRHRWRIMMTIWSSTWTRCTLIQSECLLKSDLPFQRNKLSHLRSRETQRLDTSGTMWRLKMVLILALLMLKKTILWTQFRRVMSYIQALVARTTSHFLQAKMPKKVVQAGSRLLNHGNGKMMLCSHILSQFISADRNTSLKFD